jgi:ribosome-binding ATPase YchF (GTP1/OBG family)
VASSGRDHRLGQDGFAGGWSAAKEKGWVRIEGKDYVVQDGDILNILHQG